ncbi:putative polysaccharide biosynthesis protein [Peribacillus tepidiphilus]|uniref:putative polysaccharide biosynthesis protein n=1 Tax=Peribacillus tepidiphilus TaxID=2652445 RepID=UPI0012914922|nr:polysaccharide biosynthesis protein [Peribacillus tepidiphilus]
MSSKLLRGTFILTAGMMLSKVLGLLYVIPFDALVGAKGFTLYQYGYIPYTLFISIATGGLPLAVAKFVAKYNALGEYGLGQKLFKTSMKIMLATGFLAFFVLYLIAPGLGEYYASSDPAYKPEDITQVIRAVSFALILVPIMSLIRGFFQGYESMGPTALSQVVEQIVRIVFLLLGAFIVKFLLNGSIVTAISVATFAAFIGAIGGLIVLIWYWRKRKAYLDELLLQDRGQLQISLVDMYKEILFYSIPFVFVGIAMTLFQAVDTLTFGKAMAAIGKSEETTTALGILNISANKLVVIPMTFATAFAMSIVPTVTKAFVEEKMDTFSTQLNQAFQVLLFLTIPAVVGMSLLAEPVYTAFYGYDELGVEVLKVYAPAAILFSLFSVTAAVLQGINQQKYSVLSLLIGFLLKLSLNIPLIKWFQTDGSIYATTIGYLAATLINMYVIRYFTGYRYQLVFRRTLLMIIFTGIMALVVSVVNGLLYTGLDPQHRLQAILIIMICAVIGAGVYFALALKSKLAQRLFGNRIEKWQKKIRLRAK